MNICAWGQECYQLCHIIYRFTETKHGGPDCANSNAEEVDWIVQKFRSINLEQIKEMIRHQISQSSMFESKEVILCCSRDRTVITVASARREKEQLSGAKWEPSVFLDEVFQRVTYRHNFKGQFDRKDLGHDTYRDRPMERKELTQEVTALSDEELIHHILSLADQSKWTKWDEVINLDLKWKEIIMT